MFKTKLGRSIRWKLVLVYVLLVFIATTIIGVFLTSQLESYYTNSIEQDIVNTVNEGGLTSSFAAYENLQDNAEEIDTNISSWGVGLGQETFILRGEFGHDPEILNAFFQLEKRFCGGLALAEPLHGFLGGILVVPEIAL